MPKEARSRAADGLVSHLGDGRPWCARGLAGVVLVVALVGGAPVARGLDPTRPLAAFTVEAWRVSDGLPGAWVRGVAQTAEGYLWVATYGGVARYGGDRVLTVPAERPFERLSDVKGVLAAGDGRLWIAPAEGDPVCWRAGALAPCLAGGHRLGAAPVARIEALAGDADGTVWIAASGGLFRVGRDGVPARVLDRGAPPPGPIAALARDGRGGLWIGAAGGLYLARPEPDATTNGAGVPGGGAVRGVASATGERSGDQPRPATGAPSREPPAIGPVAAWTLGAVGAIFADRSGGLWVAGVGGLMRLGPGAGGARDGGGAIEVHDRARGWPGGRPTGGLEDADGNLWIATRAGLVRLREGRFSRYGQADGLPDEDLTAIFEDREGSLWLGTRGAGLVQVTDRTLDSQAGPPSLRNAFISALCEADDGALFVATGAGLVRWKDGQETRFGQAQGLPSDNVLTVHPAAADGARTGGPGPGTGGVWVGTDRGLARWRDGTIDRPFAIDAAVSSLYVDATGVTWVGSARGLIRVQGGEHAVIPSAPELEGTEIRGINHDDGGILWASAGGRLARLEGGALRSARLIIDGSPVMRVRALHRDEAGALWVATAGGLARRAGGRWRMFTMADGLPGHELFQMVSDGHGFLWAGTSHGILRIPGRTLVKGPPDGGPRLGLVLYDTSGQRRDVAATRTRQPGAIRAGDGSLWFATARGLVRIDPARMRLRQVAPTVRIESAVLDGRPARPGVDNHFGPGAGNLEVRFGAITLLEPRKARHRYRLEGFDPGWNEAGDRRTAHYTNLPAGHYRLRVQGSNADGAWNEAGDTLELTLAPHFHRTAWFYGLVGLLVLGVGFAAHRLRVSRVRSGFAATLAERNRIARELHDSLLQGMAAAAMRLRGLRKRVTGAGGNAPDPQAVGQELREVEALVAASIVETRQTVMGLREPAGPAPGLGPALTALVRQLAEGTPVATEVTVEGPVRPLRPALHHELTRIAGEAVKNALLHAAPTQINVALCYRPDALTLSVRDDGRGFDPALAPAAGDGHFGLLGIRERAARLGSLELASAPDRGTHLAITVNGPYVEAPAWPSGDGDPKDLG